MKVPSHWTREGKSSSVPFEPRTVHSFLQTRAAPRAVSAQSAAGFGEEPQLGGFASTPTPTPGPLPISRLASSRRFFPKKINLGVWGEPASHIQPASVQAARRGPLLRTGLPEGPESP